MFQVAAAPKRKTRKDEEKVEEVKPASWETKASDAKGELLSDSAKARTESIKLSNVPYAKELADQLLSHASKLEALYKKIDQALEKKVSEKEYKELVGQVLELNNFTAKAQARSGEVFNAKRKIVHSIKRSTVLVLRGVEAHKTKRTHSKGTTARPDAKVIPSYDLPKLFPISPILLLWRPLQQLSCDQRKPRKKNRRRQRPKRRSEEMKLGTFIEE